MRDQFIIYKVTCRTSGKAYIGVTTKTLKRRWSNHVSTARRGAKPGLPGAILKYGAVDFVVEHIASSRSLEDMLLAEQIMIAQEGTLAPVGLNLTGGGQGLFNASLETRRLMSANQAAKKGTQKRSAQTRARMSAANTGRPVSEETRKRMSDKLKGRVMSPEWLEKLRAVRATPEFRANMSLKKTGKKISVPRSEETRNKLRAAWALRKMARQSASQGALFDA